MRLCFAFLLCAGVPVAFPLVAEEEKKVAPAVQVPPGAPAKKTDFESPTQPPPQYNINLPTGEQEQPVYFTKDLTLRIGTTEIGFYGFFKGDLLAETRITGNTADVRPDLIPLDRNLAGKHTQTLFDARDSRIGIKIEDEINEIKMKGAVEADFYTEDGTAIHVNSRHMRLRLAYGTAELPSHFFFLAGQYYTLAMHYPEIDMPTRVNLVHFPPGVVNSRQPQYRVGYKQYFSPTSLLQYELNAELQGYNTTGIVIENDSDTAEGSFQKWPLFTAKVCWLNKMFKWNIAYSRGEAYAVTSKTLGTRLHTPVWGVLSTASFTWKDLLIWGTLHHWVGLTGLSSNYLEQITLVNQGKRLTSLHANGGCIALRYDFLSRALWMDVMYGVERGQEVPSSERFTGERMKKIQDFRVNLIGAFWGHWQIGAEYERTWVESFSGHTGLVDMVHIGVWYVFGQP